MKDQASPQHPATFLPKPPIPSHPDHGRPPHQHSAQQEHRQPHPEAHPDRGVGHQELEGRGARAHHPGEEAAGAPRLHRGLPSAAAGEGRCQGAPTGRSWPRTL
eukprot:757037-Hanusia_phi.AAC.4